MNKCYSVLLAALVLCFAGCRQEDVRTMELNIPTLTEENVKDITRLITMPGVVKTTVKQADKKIVVRYDSMQIAEKNLELALVEKGIEVNGIQPVKTPAP